MKTAGNNFNQFRGISRPIEVRFWEKVDIDPDGCWNWTAMKDKFGYGYLAIKSIPTSAHRISMRIHLGEFDDKLRVLHKCDNPSCVRPDHLFLGTLQDNMRDRDRKGRGCRGEKHVWAKLDQNMVKKIREMYASGKTSTKISHEIGVDAGTICNIVKRRSWRWL